MLDDMTREESTAAAVIRTLAASRGVSVPELAQLIGVSRTAFYDRLAGNTAFLFREMVALADYFGVDLNVFRTGRLELTISIPESACTPLTLVSGNFAWAA
jgi:transcriptional regulator with XRE-family HTH domain